MTRTFKKVQNSAYRFTEKRVLPAFLFEKSKSTISVIPFINKVLYRKKTFFLVVLENK